MSEPADLPDSELPQEKPAERARPTKFLTFDPKGGTPIEPAMPTPGRRSWRVYAPTVTHDDPRRAKRVKDGPEPNGAA